MISFLHRVPSIYVDSIIQLLDEISDRSSQTNTPSPGYFTPSPVFDEQRIVAAEIFAHWLVFMMLLDGVWWIGDIGMWELGKLVSFMESAGWVDEQTWWPSNMYRIKKSIRTLSPGT